MIQIAQTRHILVGHDGSRNAETAFEDALDLAALAHARLAQERHVTIQTRVLVGHAADQILKAAAAQGADVIVVGHRVRAR